MIPFSDITFFGIVLIGAMIILILSCPDNDRTSDKEKIIFMAAVLIVIGISAFIDYRYSMAAALFVLICGSYLSYI